MSSQQATTSSPAALRALIDAAIDDLDDEEKKDYMLAKKEVPKVVEQESHPLWFLERENNDPVAAARCLVKHWEKRRGVYGSRFLLPVLNLTGQGALSRESLQLMALGFHYALPVDEHGRFVLVVDHRVYENDIGRTKQTRFQSFFYFLILASMSEKTRRKGIVIFRIANNFPLDKDRISNISKTIDEAMPFHAAEFRFCSYATKAAQRAFKQQAPAIKYFCDTVRQPIKFTIATCPQEMIVKMQQDGYKASKLSPALGGSWDNSVFLNQIHRIARECPKIYRATTVVARCIGEEDVVKLVESEDQPQAEKRRARKRTMDIEYARKRRIKEKEEEEQAIYKCAELTNQNRRLKVESSRLRGLLNRALLMVAEIKHCLQQEQHHEEQICATLLSALPAGISAHVLLQHLLTRDHLVPQGARAPQLIATPLAIQQLQNPRTIVDQRLAPELILRAPLPQHSHAILPRIDSTAMTRSSRDLIDTSFHQYSFF